MRIAATLPLAAVAAAFVLPDASVFAELEVKVQEGHDKVSEWWDHVPSKESILSTATDAFDQVSHSVQHVFSDAKDGIERLLDEEIALDGDFEEFDDEHDDDGDEDDSLDRPKKGHRHHGGRHGRKRKPRGTIWEQISKSKHTTILAKLVGEYKGLVDALNGTDANYTLFAPTDEAFKKIPHHGDKDKKPPKELVEKILKYHVVPGVNPARRIIYRHTLPTALEEPLLGDHAQRLRVRVGLRGVRVNFYSKVIAANFPATNGIIHGVNNVLFPPPMAGRLITLFPQRFSTLLLAYEKTDFVKYVHSIPMPSGATVFAPSNAAFTRLGPRANAFLFNTEKGKKYLKAILKYHIVANQTLYSDAYYGPKKGDGEEELGVEETGGGRYHVDLPTLLDDKSVAVDVARWGVFIRVKVNGYVPVVVQDGIAKNGVIHVVGRVLIPPHKHGKGDEVVEGEISVEELTERLRGYVEEDGDDGKEEYFGEL